MEVTLSILGLSLSIIFKKSFLFNDDFILINETFLLNQKINCKTMWFPCTPLMSIIQPIFGKWCRFSYKKYRAQLHATLRVLTFCLSKYRVQPNIYIYSQNSILPAFRECIVFSISSFNTFFFSSNTLFSEKAPRIKQFALNLSNLNQWIMMITLTMLKNFVSIWNPTMPNT